MGIATSGTKIRLFCLWWAVFAAAGNGNAQQIQWGGVVESGIKATFGDSVKDEDGNKEVRVQTSCDDGADGVRAMLNAIVFNESRGVKIGTRADYRDQPDGTHLGIYNAYGWINFLENKINVKTGLIDDAVWVSPGAGEYHFSTNKGIRVEVMPIGGLNLGAFLNFGGGFGPITASQWVRETGFGASYNKHPYNAAAGLKLASDRIPDNEDRSKAYFGFRYWGLPNYVFSIDGQFDNLGDFNRQGHITFNERAAYHTSSLIYGFVFTQNIRLTEKENEDDKKKKALYRVALNPFGEYGISNSLRAGAEFPLGFFDTDDSLKFHSLTINPWIRYSVSGAWVRLSYAATRTSKDFTASKEAMVDHRIILGFAYYF